MRVHARARACSSLVWPPCQRMVDGKHVFVRVFDRGLASKRCAHGCTHLRLPLDPPSASWVSSSTRKEVTVRFVHRSLDHPGSVDSQGQGERAPLSRGEHAHVLPHADPYGLAEPLGEHLDDELPVVDPHPNRGVADLHEQR